MKRIIILTFLLVLKALMSDATMQSREKLIYKKDTFLTSSHPLDEYFNHQKIQEIFKGSNDFSTACYRGYNAVWKIENDSLFLIELYSPAYAVKADLSIVFRDLYKSNRVFASWVTDDLSGDFGKFIGHDIYCIGCDKYEKSFIFKIKSGLLNKINYYTDYILSDNKLYRGIDSKVVDTLRQFIYKLPPENFKGGLKNYIITIDENGLISDMVEKNSDEKNKIRVKYSLDTVSGKWSEKYYIFFFTDEGYHMEDVPDRSDIIRNDYTNRLLQLLKNMGSWDIIQKFNMPIKQEYEVSLNFPSTKIKSRRKRGIKSK